MANLSKVVKLTQEQYNTLASGGTVGDYTGLDPTFLYLVEDMGDIIDVSNGVTAEIRDYLIAHPATLLKYGNYIYVAQYTDGTLGSEAPAYYNCFEGDEGDFHYLVIDWGDLTIENEEVYYLRTTGTAYDSTRLGGHTADYFINTSSTAQTKSGNLTLNGVTDVSGGTLKLRTINAPTASGGSTYGPGTSGQVLKSNGTTVYWATDTNSDTWRNVKVDATQVLGTGTDTGPLAFLSQNTNNGDISFTYDSTNKGVKATAKMPTALKNPNAVKIQGGGQDVASYDGSAAKTFNFAASTTAGAFTISDGTTTRTIQLAGSFTDYNQTIKVGNTTFGANAVVELVAGTNVDSIVANATNNTITINTHDTTYTTATTTAAGLMSAADKVKLNGIATGAEVNVQSDWSVTDTSSDAFIKNKPSIPVVTNYYWADVQVSASSNKGTTPTVSKITIGGSGSTAGKATMQYNATEDCIDFIFA